MINPIPEHSTRTCFSSNNLDSNTRNDQRMIPDVDTCRPHGNSINYLFSDNEKRLIDSLCEAGQEHLFDNWHELGCCDEEKKAFVAQLMKLDAGYPGGILQYCNTARKLLSDAAQGINPLDGWIPEVPHGISLEPGTVSYSEKESLGMQELGKVGFVLVAGGLGERLGYSGIKIGLSVESTTGITYLELYCQHILAIQKRYCTNGQTLPLAIMVSDDTIQQTQCLLEQHHHFGLEITLLKQEKVPALKDSQARLTKSSTYILDSKPHGHGDVHVLMHSSGTAKRWLEKGIKWVTFFQDTNGLAFTTLSAALGVSIELNLLVNSVTVPRYAKQAVGAIAKLRRKDNSRTMTINVEYNQLDPLLRATINPEGDVNEAATGRSIFPGNINQLIFELHSYQQHLMRCNGVMGEFVNAKYTDATKTNFKTATRLECLMQDYPKELTDPNDAIRVGFTQFPAWVCYSPCKNNAKDAASSLRAGVPAGCPWISESDQYACTAQLLRLLGCHVERSSQPATFLDITATPGPRIVLKSSTAIFLKELAAVFPSPQNVHISANSTLVVSGDVIIEHLELDGALILQAVPGTKLIVSASGPTGRVVNRGHEFIALSEELLANGTCTETQRMKGYILETREETIITTESTHASPCNDLRKDNHKTQVFTFTNHHLMPYEDTHM